MPAVLFALKRSSRNLVRESGQHGSTMATGSSVRIMKEVGGEGQRIGGKEANRGWEGQGIGGKEANRGWEGQGIGGKEVNRGWEG